ncbi:MAG: serine/threonine protein kinase, partial [Myxococcales bacterium]|nr:serine/threonine protein kinase [Myxococcales bacterium]
MAEVPQKSLERYDVLDRIAVGGMAEVFLAKAYGAHGFEKTLAIKRILPELARDPEFEERFIAEAKVAVRLSHANVVQVFDFGRFAGSLFIAMEYVDGLDLAALLRRHKELARPLPVPAAFHIGVELARGLDFAHQHGVVHRDVSPSNILLSRAGEVKIADFGIAVAARPERPKPGAKRKVMGKWRYMSPEQARGEPVDPRSDIFSMAVVLYELLTGEKLFPGDEVEDIVRNINDMPLPRPSEIRRDLPRRVDEILLPALSREPGRRPTRAAVIQRALTELSYESSIVATALDVADAVSLALDLSPAGNVSGKHSLDLLLRHSMAENLGQPGPERRTALTTNQHSTAVTASKLYRDKDGAPLVITREAIILGAEEAEAEDAADEGEKDRVTEPVQLQNLGDETTSRAVLERRIDPDGITHLEFDATTISGTPRTKRLGSAP